MQSLMNVHIIGHMVPEQRPPTVLNLAPEHSTMSPERSTMSSERLGKKDSKKADSTRRDIRKADDFRVKTLDNQRNSERYRNQIEEQSRGEMKSCKRMPGRETQGSKSDTDQSDIRHKGV